MKAARLALVFALAACAAPVPTEQTLEPGTGLAFGAFDVTGSDIAVTHVALIRVSPTKVYMGGSGERATVTYTNGEFYSANLSPGVYSITSFYSGNRPFLLEGGLRGNTFKVEPGGVVYAGTYRLHYKKTGAFQRDDASFERADSRGAELALLRWLEKALAASPWAGPVRSRRAEAEKRR